MRTVFDPTKAASPDHFFAADHDTVWLVRDHVDIDVERFLDEAAEGRRMLASGDHGKAKSFLANAVARATRQAVLEHARLGYAVPATVDGKVVWIQPAEILARLGETSNP